MSTFVSRTKIFLKATLRRTDRMDFRLPLSPDPQGPAWRLKRGLHSFFDHMKRDGGGGHAVLPAKRKVATHRVWRKKIAPGELFSYAIRRTRGRSKFRNPRSEDIPWEVRTWKRTEESSRAREYKKWMIRAA